MIYNNKYIDIIDYVSSNYKILLVFVKKYLQK